MGWSDRAQLTMTNCDRCRTCVLIGPALAIEAPHPFSSSSFDTVLLCAQILLRVYCCSIAHASIPALLAAESFADVQL